MPGEGKKNNDKGKEWERAIVRYLKEHGFPLAERKLAGKIDDRADIGGIPPCFSIQCKNWTRIDLSAMVADAMRGMTNSGADFGVMVQKRARRGTGQAYTVMPFEVFVQLMVRVATLEESRELDSKFRRKT
jgi:hypothetical protein